MMGFPSTVSGSILVTENNSQGKISLVANGEDFIRQGFTTKDNWQIQFDNVYVTITEVQAYQTDPPFDPNSTSPLKAQETVVLLGEPKTVDLAEGDENAKPILVSTVTAPPGQYNALSWKVTPSSEGATIVLQGTATKEGETINFNIAIAQPLEYVCGEYVGDDRKGILQANSETELEITFHFDHLFGDGEIPADDPLNTDALGFAPLASLAENGQLEIDSATLKEKLSPQDYQTLEKAIAGLGHVGEGHCH